ncbi:MAG: hypothetical protein HeimC3_23890 [Candidatus Heimdallarchaeota archaeon LC_3]|nr:MAG: hypothetical protein HeimC3_23890 [Candidatus Heimdallarchaeota archaeon LC_3]
MVELIDLIISKSDHDVFFNYLSKANSRSIKLAKKLFSWKFDSYLREKDVKQKKKYTT